MIRGSATHICVLNRNIGDNALNAAIRSMLRRRFRIRHLELLGERFDAGTLRALNRSGVVLFGGGGLIHSYGPRGNAWERTGTMWNITLDDLEALQAPVVLYGVGYNHFYGDPPPHPRMKNFFEVLTAKGSLIGLRNDGSKLRLLQQFPWLESSLVEIPDPGVFFRAKRYRQTRPYIVLQIAADRPKLRYGNDLEGFSQLVTTLCNRVDFDVFLVPHTIDDERLYPTLPLSIRRLNRVPLEKRASHVRSAMKLYTGAAFTISTRGHSQICSIGHGVPTFSLSTHPKVLAFAESTNMADWCVDMRSATHDDVVERFDDFIRWLPALRARLPFVNHKFREQIERFNRRVVEKSERLS
ncbi:MAG: polysaccharide pyruvyl transferase family protein [Myxococcota bacterium]